MGGLTIFAKLWGSNVTMGIQIILCNSEVTLKVKYPRYIAQSWDELRETAKCILKSSILLSANMNLDCIWFGFEIYIILSLLLKIETANKINYNIYWVYFCLFNFYVLLFCFICRRMFQAIFFLCISLRSFF